MTELASRSVTTLKGVGPKLAETLARLGIFRYVDLLLHLPYRYQDRTRITAAINITPDQPCLVEGRVVGCHVLFGKRRSLKVTLQDETGRMHLRFFHFSRFQQKNLERAGYVRAYGEFRFYGRELTAAHPEYETFDDALPEPDGTLTPVYPTTQGLGQARLRQIVGQLRAMRWPDGPGRPFTKLLYLHEPPSGTTLEEVADVQLEVALVMLQRDNQVLHI